MNQPHGGKLVNKIANDARKKELEAKAKNLFQLTIEDRYAADVEMIAIGAFSPLEGFMGKADCESAIEKMELTNGLAWGIPILYLQVINMMKLKKVKKLLCLIKRTCVGYNEC